MVWEQLENWYEKRAEIHQMERGPTPGSFPLENEKKNILHICSIMKSVAVIILKSRKEQVIIVLFLFAYFVNSDWVLIG